MGRDRRDLPDEDRSLEERAVQILAGGHLTVAYVDGTYVAAVFHDESSLCNLGFEAGRGWWCSCDEGLCAHLRALMLVTARAVERAEAEAGIPRPGERPPQGEIEERGQGGGQRLLAFSATALLLLGAFLGLLWAGRSREAPPAARASFPSPTVTDGAAGQSPEARDEPSREAARPAASFPREVVGDAVELRVDGYRRPDPDCVNHAFSSLVAYQTDCKGWPGFDLAWFHLSLANTGSADVTVRLSQFVLVDEAGDFHRTVDVSSRSGDSSAFLLERSTLGPEEELSGWVTFEAPDEPARLLRYAGPGGPVEIEFPRPHTVTSAE